MTPPLREVNLDIYYHENFKSHVLFQDEVITKSLQVLDSGSGLWSKASPQHHLRLFRSFNGTSLLRHHQLNEEALAAFEAALRSEWASLCVLGAG